MTSYSSHAEEEEVEEETSHLYHSSLYPLDVYAGGGPHSAAPSGMEQFSSFTAQCKGDDEHFVLGVTEHEQRQLLKRHPPTRNDLQHRDFESQVHRGCATTAPNIHIQVPRMDLNPATIKNQALASSPQSRESPTDYVPHMNNAHQINYLSSQEHDLRKQINVPKHKYNRNQGFNSFNDAIAYNVPRTNSVASTGIKLSTFPDFVSLADTIHTPVAIKDENLFSHSHAESAGSTKNATKRSAANFSFPDQTAVSEGHSASKMTGQTEETLLHNNSSKLLVTAEMSHSAYRDTDMLINSQCNGYGAMMPSESCQLSFFEGQREQKSHPHRRNDDNFSVFPLSQNNLPELQCEESLVKEPSPRLSPIFHCPECAQDFQYNTPKTAAALFAIHRRGCGQTTKDASKRMKSGDEGGNRLRGKRIVQRTYVDERQQRGTKRRHGRHNSSFSIGVCRTPRNVIERHYSPVATVVPAPRINKKKNKIQIQTQTTATTLAIDAPQKYKNAFDFFNTSRLTISKGHSAKQGEIKSQWKSMTIEERKPFVLMARRDRDRYNREMQVVDNKNIEQRSNLQSDPTEGTNEEIPVGKSVNVSKSKSEISPSGEKYVTVSKFKSCRMETSSDSITAQSSYPYAPLGHLWLEKSLKSSMYLNCEADMGRSNASGNSLFGRRWVWDEGYFVDGHLNPRADKNYRKGCTCGSNHLFSVLNTIQKHSPSNAAISIGKTRRSDRSAYSSSVTSQLADGQLDPHTLIICDDYELGPEYRFMKDPQTESVQPFSVRVNPDVTFIADLHSHLSRMEIIGLLGGYYSKEEKCIYVQAAFPCKSTDRTDSGLTDVEMDPVCQIYAIDAIANHGMTAVGWYHSHPDFQPIPSITDIDNQANYQQLFQGGDLVGMIAEVSPFVGLIVGTYDGKNPTSQSEMRWFHVRSRESTGAAKTVNFPMNLKTTDRHYRKMTFDAASIVTNIRRSMSLHSPGIRQRLESQYLSCCSSGSSKTEINHVLSYTKQVSNFSEHIKQSERSNESYHMTMTENHKQIDTGIICSLSLLETGESPLLLSGAIFGEASMRRFQPAYPLYFNENERSILELDHNDVPCDVFAGIIWFAVEREQRPRSESSIGSVSFPCIPASSRSILDLILRQSVTLSNTLEVALYEMIHCLDNVVGLIPQKFQLHENDAAILHSLDAVLHHYASKSDRINPFSSWRGAGDKGNIIKDYGLCSDPWLDYYLTTILKVESLQTDEGRAYRGGVKMKRGHKIAACLLRWTRNMQLSDYNEIDKLARFSAKDSRGSGIQFDHEQRQNELSITLVKKSTLQDRDYIYFVAEVMRLLAARWRESGSSLPHQIKEGGPKKRGRPAKIQN